VGPEGALAVLVVSGVAPLAGQGAARYAELAAALAVVVGGIFVVARVVRLGWIADYFSRPVLVGYIHGVAVVLIVGQIGKLLGLQIEADDSVPQLLEAIDEVTEAHGLTIAVGAASIALLLLLRWRWPSLPGPLVVVVLGIAVSAAAELGDHGVAVVGDLLAGLPGLTWPDVDGSDLVKLLPAALGIAAVACADGVLTGRSFAGRHRQHIDANQELLAFGAANLAAGISQGFPVGASGSRTAVTDQMGGETQIVGLIGAAVIVVVLLFLTEPVEYLPSACLGAVIVMAAIGLIEPSAWRAIASAGRAQVVVAAVACGGVIVLGVLPALVIAVGLSILDTVRRSATPHDAVLGWVPRLGRYANVAVHSSAEVTPGVVVYRLDDRLIFANARYVKGRITEAIAGAPTPTRALVLDAEAISELDASGAEAIQQLVDDLRASEITLVVARMKQPTRDRADATGLTDLIGPDNFHPTVRAAVERWARPADPDVPAG
jgi:high affinity sulfate transporter 1